MISINQEDSFINMSYKNDTDYFAIFNEIETDYYNSFNKKKLALEIFFNSEAMDFMERQVIKEAHASYYNSLDYSLIELLNHFKAILKIYGDYLIVDYKFHGVFLKNNNSNMCNCIFDGFDEEFEDELNYHLLGKTLNDFVKILTSQKRLGNIRIKEIKIILLNKKAKGKSKRRKTNVPRGLRHEVFKRDKYTCCECGAKKEDGVTLHIDHIIPVSKGGTDELSNLQTLCADCNLNKSNIIQKKVKS